MSKVIGIDLGTTNSCVAIVEQGEPVILANAEGQRVTPSVVAITDTGDRLIGELAKRQGITNARNTVAAIKRFVGRDFSSSEVERAGQSASFEIQQSEAGDVRVMLQDLEYSPEEISAMILMKMRTTAEEYLGEEVHDAVITVPAYFDDRQRQATKDGGKIAGLNVLRIINEPTAASLAYGIQKKSRETVAVYDLGGGTFDISVLELSEGVFEVKATRGDTFLGGEDFDHRVIDWMVERFHEDTGIELRGDPVVLQRLKEAAERAKIELSTALETSVNLPFIAADDEGPKHLEYTLTRADFENLIHDLVERSIEPCRLCLDDAGLTVDDIDTLLLIGGQTRTPLVYETVKEFFERIPLKGINADEVVAAGAAIQAGVLQGEVEDTVLLDVIPLSLGVETFGGVCTKVVERNTSIPTRVSRLFSTAEDNQDMVRVHVLQGEREMAEDNRSLGIFELFGIPPQPRGVPQVEVIFEIDHNGLLNVTARDRGTGREQAIRITNSGGLSTDDIEGMVGDADRYRESDLETRERVRVLNSLSNLVYQCKRTLADRRDELDDENRRRLENAISELETSQTDTQAGVEELLRRRDEILEVIRDAMV